MTPIDAIVYMFALIGFAVVVATPAILVIVMLGVALERK